jgi:hypothetical protein
MMAMERAGEALRSAEARLSVAERRRLVLDLVNKPEAMIRDAVAVEAFQRVLELTHIVEKWERGEMTAFVAALNRPRSILLSCVIYGGR